MTDKYADKLSHLSEEQIQDLMSKYYSGEKNSTLIEDYKIDIQSSLLVKTFPLKSHLDFMCPYCKVPMKSYQKSKSSYSYSKIFCVKCNHEESSYQCTCLGCIEYRSNKNKAEKMKQKIAEDKSKNILLEEFLESNKTPIEVNNLTLKDKLYVSALLRASSNENCQSIDPISSSHLVLAPTSQYIGNIVGHLINNDIVLISPDTDLKSVIIEEGIVVKYYPEQVTLKLNTTPDNTEKLTKYLLSLDDIEIVDITIKRELWQEIAIHELLEYLFAKILDYNLPTDHIGEKTILTLKKVLDNYSTSQVFNFIWGAAKDAAAYYQKDNISKKHAVNTVPSNILRRSEKALAENWETKGFNRDYNYPQSIISEVFFNKILKIGEKGFLSVLPEEDIL